MKRSLMVAAVALASACVDDPRYAGLDVTVIAVPPVDDTITAHEFDLVVATAVKVAVAPQSNGTR